MSPPLSPAPSRTASTADPAPRAARSSRPPQAGALARIRQAFFANRRDAVLTLALVAAIAVVAPRLLDWLVLDAVWGPQPAAACEAVRGQGACWAVVWEKFRVMMFATYPYGEQWRPGLAIGVLIALPVLSAWPRMWNAALPAIWVAGSLLAFWLMGGGFGLATVPASQWGGLPVTLMLTIYGIGFAFPLALLLALGRRSGLPVLRALSITWIEVVRGVPLITVLFMASVMFALFMPAGFAVDQLLRAQVAIIVFVAAYLAEVIRGGLQAVPKGQYEAARALGLPYWRMMGLVILPQALRIAIPPIVNSFIALFKDTSLVMVIAIFDFTYAVKKSVETDVAWKKYFMEALLFSMLVYWIGCYAMSRYSRWLEQRSTQAR
ncbi:MAG: amino acid ABC transporter permease [Pseudomonadota bacterium]|nr:amino acid ABC transporter permease [Pseudomonadota bacterium]